MISNNGQVTYIKASICDSLFQHCGSKMVDEYTCMVHHNMERQSVYILHPLLSGSAVVAIIIVSKTGGVSLFLQNSCSL